MRTEYKIISGVERISCYKNLDADADVFPDVVINEYLTRNKYDIHFADNCDNVNINKRETALKIAELYINDMEEG